LAELKKTGVELDKAIKYVRARLEEDDSATVSK
jgi:hypothetical protein